MLAYLIPGLSVVSMLKLGEKLLTVFGIVTEFMVRKASRAPARPSQRQHGGRAQRMAARQAQAAQRAAGRQRGHARVAHARAAPQRHLLRKGSDCEAGLWRNSTNLSRLQVDPLPSLPKSTVAGSLGSLPEASAAMLSAEMRRCNLSCAFH